MSRGWEYLGGPGAAALVSEPRPGSPRVSAPRSHLRIHTPCHTGCRSIFTASWLTVLPPLTEEETKVQRCWGQLG